MADIDLTECQSLQMISDLPFPAVRAGKGPSGVIIPSDKKLTVQLQQKPGEASRASPHTLGSASTHTITETD